MHRGHLEEGIPRSLSSELLTELVARGPLRIERIVSRGHCSPRGFWYDQDETEFVLLVTGAAVLEIEGEPKQGLRPGDWVEIPAHARHRVDWTDPDRDTIWLAVFYPDRTSFK